MLKQLRIITVIAVFVHALWACTDSDYNGVLPTNSQKEITVLFEPGGWGDGGYNDLIYKGLIGCLSDGKLQSTKVNYYNPANMQEAEKVIKQWKADTLTTSKKLLVLASSSYRETLRKMFSDYPVDTVRQKILFFESDDVNMEGVNTFNISMYGVSYMVGVLASELGFEPVVALGNSLDSVISKAAAGFCDGFTDTDTTDYLIGRVSLSDSNEGYDMADSAYVCMFDWCKSSNFIFPVMGGSVMGVFRYIREYPQNLFTIGTDVDQSDLCHHILGSMLKHIDVVFKKYLEMWAAGEPLPRTATFGLGTGYTEWKNSFEIKEYPIDLNKIKAQAIIKENEHEGI